MRPLVLIAVFVALTGAANKPLKPGVERWPIKTSLPKGVSAKATTVALADLLALPDAAGVGKNDKRYQSARIPGKAGDKLPEGKLVSTTGYLHLVAGESDGDYHIQISASCTDGNNCLIVEVPDPDPAFTASAALQPKAQAVRDFIKTKLLADKVAAFYVAVNDQNEEDSLPGQLA